MSHSVYDQNALEQVKEIILPTPLSAPEVGDLKRVYSHQGMSHLNLSHTLFHLIASTLLETSIVSPDLQMLLRV